MNPAAIRIVFSDHGSVRDNSTIAAVEIELFMNIARDFGIRLERVTNTAEIFERAIVHLEDADLEAFTKKLETPLIALRVTTARPGVPPAKFHIRGSQPSRIIFAVRRMEALTEPEVWTSFLRASEDDCIAIYEGRISDLRDEARPMLRLFVEREEAMSALRILCLAFEEAHNRAAHGGDIWHARARE